MQLPADFFARGWSKDPNVLSLMVGMQFISIIVALAVYRQRRYYRVEGPGPGRLLPWCPLRLS